MSSQKVSYVSFQNTDNLQVYFTNLDSGDKTVIVDNVAYLTLSGRMYERAASMRIFVRNSPSVQFEDFYATTPILLINLMVSSELLFHTMLKMFLSITGNEKSRRYFFLDQRGLYSRACEGFNRNPREQSHAQA